MKATKPQAGYLGPESGPFKCGNCTHYKSDACELVAGKIDDNGCCNLYDKKAEEKAAASWKRTK